MSSLFLNLELFDIHLQNMSLSLKVSLFPSSDTALNYYILFCMMSSSWCNNVVKKLLFSEFGAVYCLQNYILKETLSYNDKALTFYIIFCMTLSSWHNYVIIIVFKCFFLSAKILFDITVWPRKRKNYS